MFKRTFYIEIETEDEQTQEVEVEVTYEAVPKSIVTADGRSLRLKDLPEYAQQTIVANGKIN